MQRPNISILEYLNAARNGELEVVQQYIRENRIDPVNEYDKAALILADAYGHPAIAQALTVASRRAITADEFLKAADAGNLEVVKQYIKQSYNYELGDINEALNAARHGSPEALDNFFKENNAQLANKLNVADSKGFTALMYAALSNRIAVVEELLTVSGIDITASDNSNRTALTLAALFGNTNIVKRLLKVPGINVNAKGPDGPPLMCAAKHGHLDIVKALLAAPGLDINAVNNAGNTALIYAAVTSYFNLTQILVAHGADLNLKNKGTITAKMLASDEVTKFVLEHETAATARKKLDEFTLKRKHQASSVDAKGMQELASVSIDSATSDIQFLMAHLHEVEDYTCLPDLVANFSKLLAAVAEQKELGENARMLLKAAATRVQAAAKYIVENYQEEEKFDTASSAVSAQDNSAEQIAVTKITSYEYFNAIQHGHLETVQKYINENRNNADSINITQGVDNTGLMIACSLGHRKIVEFLLTVPGLEVNAVNMTGNTALHIAVQGEEISENDRIIVELLLVNGADIDLKNMQNKTPEMLAKNNIIRYLIQHHRTSTVKDKLDEFVSKRNRQAKSNATAKDLQELTDLSINSALKDIEFLSAHINEADHAKLAELVVAFATLLIVTNNGKDLDHHSRALLRVAANMGNEFATRVVANFREERETDNSSYLASSYPAYLNLFGVRQTKVTGPRVVAALHKMHKDNKDGSIAHLVAGQFLLWAKKHNKHFSAGVTKEIKSIANVR